MTKTFYSFQELRDEMQRLHPEWKFKEQKPRKERIRKCRICGTAMTHIPNTNVWICTGMKTIPDPTDENPEQTKQEPCTNHIFDKDF